MSSRQDGTRYCGWLLHGHPWCGTHGHQCEDLDPRARNEREGVVTGSSPQAGSEHRPTRTQMGISDKSRVRAPLEELSATYHGDRLGRLQYRINIRKDDAIPVLVERSGRSSTPASRMSAGNEDYHHALSMDVHDVQLPDSL